VQDDPLELFGIPENIINRDIDDQNTETILIVT
jgi:hypothetical protein